MGIKGGVAGNYFVHCCHKSEQSNACRAHWAQWRHSVRTGLSFILLKIILILCVVARVFHCCRLACCTWTPVSGNTTHSSQTMATLGCTTVHWTPNGPVGPQVERQVVWAATRSPLAHQQDPWSAPLQCWGHPHSNTPTQDGAPSCGLKAESKSVRQHTPSSVARGTPSVEVSPDDLD